MDGYDLIGDIHGQAQPLQVLLERLGYRKRRGCYRHPRRQAVFLGDFIDRGPRQQAVLETVRAMTEEGAALAVLGNHEFNALAFHEPDPDHPGQHLRPQSERNIAQHQAFLDEYLPRPRALAEVLNWFRRLPLWLDLGELRVVHAAWDPHAVERLQTLLPMAGEPLPTQLLVAATRPGSPEFAALETLLKGFEADLPGGVSFTDKSGNVRTRTRLKWWRDSREETWRSLCLVPPATAQQLPDAPLPAHIRTGYPSSAPPVFVGHYWFRGRPAPLAANVACLDYSVALPQGKLVAYRWDGEPHLSADRFVWVERHA